MARIVGAENRAQRVAIPLFAIAALISAGAAGSGRLVQSAAGSTGPPFAQCPPVGVSPTCGILIVINTDRSVSVVDDTNVGPYDGGDDTLVGIQNNSILPVDALTVSGQPGSSIFGFDGDGLCTFGVAGCPFGTTGYEGPGTSFVNDPATFDRGEVDFATGGLAANSSAYFSLEGALTAASLTVRRGHLAGRYIALGDSIPYGHGLVNPGFKGQDGLPPQQGPSTDAYPSLLATHLGLSLLVRPTVGTPNPPAVPGAGCILTGDQLAVSGANSDRTNTEGPDNDCPSRIIAGVGISHAPHKAVDPEELTAAGLCDQCGPQAEPPSLVTIQVGANDINFVGCLVHELQIPRNPFVSSEKCVDGPARNGHLTKDVEADLAELGNALDHIVTQIEKAAPQTSIALLDYFQIVPKPSDPIFSDGSAICDDLRAAVPGGKFRRGIYDDAMLIQTRLNDKIKSVQAKHQRVLLVDLGPTAGHPDVFDGHAMCSAPDSTQGTSRLFTEAWRAGHPTALGQQEIEARIEDACSKQSCVGQ